LILNIKTMANTKKIPKTTNSDDHEHTISGHESWHAFEIMAEFVGATERLKEITPAVSIFGSARTPADHPYYKLTEEIARLLSDSGFSVILAAARVLWRPRTRAHLPESRQVLA
jgi:hypothetical protein